ncbi:hypothetical protein Taro_052228 [Colocasia esculenta]|uniref:procollagen-proline 4-dioxygenase n=1 Tax=Colocasia esculenta TaxID=4460 RepID=A0A843XJL5_COLES|nr:hypothetical protein [Colocasia esculenta]
MARAFGLMKNAKARALHFKRASLTWTLGMALLLLLSVVLVMRLAVSIFSLPVSTDPPKRNTAAERRLDEAASVGVHGRAAEFDGLGERKDQWIEVVSWEPRAAVYHNFLSKEECEYLIGLAKPHLAKSSVVDSTTGKSKDSGVRTSFGMFLARGKDKVVRAIEKRIADFTHLPVEHGEGLQILHYDIGQKYEPHFDYFMDEYNTKNGGQRMATVLISDVEEGGETIFPNAKVNHSSLPYYNELSECGKKGLSVKPKMGDAVLFWSMKPDATLDPSSLHGACPVIRGNKWAAPKWIRVHEYKKFKPT